MDTYNKKKLDKFYTKRSIAERLIDISCDILRIDKEKQKFIEPSAGDGAFSDQLYNVVAYDLCPESSGIIEQDFLLDFPIEDAENRISIGNPPFGKKGKMAIEFLNKCGRLTKAVCFILPSTFRRWSVQSKIDKSLRLIYDEDLPLDSFEFDGNTYSLNCVFQIWSKEMRVDLPNLRIRSKPPISHPDFQLWQHNGSKQSREYLYEDWDIATYRQGYKDYNKIFTKDKDFDELKNMMENTSIQFFFIKFNNNKARDIIMNMDFDKLAHKNLSTPGFGKADFVSEYSKYL